MYAQIFEGLGPPPPPSVFAGMRIVDYSTHFDNVPSHSTPPLVFNAFDDFQSGFNWQKATILSLMGKSRANFCQS